MGKGGRDRSVCNSVSNSVRKNITHYFARMQLIFIRRLTMYSK